MIQEIENRRSIRKYKEDKISKKLLEEIIYTGRFYRDRLSADRNCCCWSCK